MKLVVSPCFAIGLKKRRMIDRANHAHTNSTAAYRIEQVWRAEDLRERPSDEVADDAAQDAGADENREEALGLPRIAHRARDVPRQQADGRTDDVDRNPQHRIERGNLQRDGGAFDQDHDGERDQHQDEEAALIEFAEAGGIGKRDGEVSRAQQHEHVRQILDAEARVEQGIGRIATQAASRFDQGEQGGDEDDEPRFTRSDLEERRETLHSAKVR